MDQLHKRLIHSQHSPLPVRTTSIGIANNIVQLYADLFKGTIAISTLVASITFQVIIQQIDQDDLDWSVDHRIHYKGAHSLLAVAWMLCVSALGIACIAYGVLTLNQDDVEFTLNVEATADSTRWRPVYRFYIYAGALASLICQALLLTAFFLCSLAVSAYSEKAGWKAAGVVVIFMAAALVLWPWQLRKPARSLPVASQRMSTLGYA